jgi:SAM-dependent methyltransferase
MSVTTTQSSGQSDDSISANAQYFLQHLQEYEKSVAELDTYRTIHNFISAKVAGVGQLLDVGNGGVFCYDASGVGTITAIDLFLNDIPADLVKAHFPPNARPQQGSALALPVADGTFDMVLMVMLLHHLSGHDWRSSWDNARKAMAEGWRVLKPGGRFLIVESCVPEWFFSLEKPAFRILSSLTRSIFSHPVTFQFPVRMIEDEFKQKASDVRVHAIPKGKHILQFGFKVLSILTPVQLFGIEVQKGN